MTAHEDGEPAQLRAEDVAGWIDSLRSPVGDPAMRDIGAGDQRAQ